MLLAASKAKAKRGLASCTDCMTFASNVETPRPGPSYDPVLASSHSYLGDIWDVSGSGSDAVLPAGSHWLPVLPLEGVVLVPGGKLPLLAARSSEVSMTS
jgi:hypothetical protein